MKRFFISAGEASGETHGAQLIRALSACLPDAEFFGLGGNAMRAAGCDTVVDTRDVAVLGLAEVLTHLPKIYGKFNRLLHAADERKPAAAILIDFPDFNFRLARQLHRRGIAVFYYISPQLWAWRKGRIKLVQRYVRKMLAIFPFEQEFYRQHGVDAIYVGHPFAEIERPSLARPEFAAQNGLDPSRQWIALLPGSRRKEVLMNLPAMLASARSLGSNFEYLLPVAPTLDSFWLDKEIERIGGAYKYSLNLTTDVRATLAQSRAAIVASGTATLEAALIGTPFVMVYRLSSLTWTLGRRFVNVPHFGIVNLILGRRAVPELVQHEFSAANVVRALEPLIADGAARNEQLADFAELRQKLHPHDQYTAAQRAAKVILDSL